MFIMSEPFFIISCARAGSTLLRSILNSHSKIAIPLESLFIIDYLKTEITDLDLLKELIIKEYEIKEWGIELKYSDFINCKNSMDLIAKIHELYINKYNKESWGQKTPRFVRHADLLKSKFPNAKFIIIVRDPRSVVSSLINSNVHKSNLYYACLRWNKDVNYGKRIKKTFPESTKVILYEELVAKPNVIMSDICSFFRL